MTIQMPSARFEYNAEAKQKLLSYMEANAESHPNGFLLKDLVLWAREQKFDAPLAPLLTSLVITRKLIRNKDTHDKNHYFVAPRKDN